MAPPSTGPGTLAALPVRYFPGPDHFSFRDVQRLDTLVADADFRGVLEGAEKAADPTAGEAEGEAEEDDEDTHGWSWLCGGGVSRVLYSFCKLHMFCFALIFEVFGGEMACVGTRLF